MSDLSATVARTQWRRLREFVSAVKPDFPAVDQALPVVRDLLRSVQASYKLIGGIDCDTCSVIESRR